MNSFRAHAVNILPVEHISRKGKERTWSYQVLASSWTITVCKLLIGVVSAYDIHQTVKYVEFLPQLELNPIGRLLMGLDDGPQCDLQQVACFISAKFMGNFTCLVIIEMLSKWRPRLAVSVAIPVAAFQLMLLYFLVYGES